MGGWLLTIAAGCPWIPAAEHFGDDGPPSDPTVGPSDPTVGPSDPTVGPSDPPDASPDTPGAPGSTAADTATGASEPSPTGTPSTGTSVEVHDLGATPFTGLANLTPADVTATVGPVGAVEVTCPLAFTGSFGVTVVGDELQLTMGAPDPVLSFSDCAIAVTAPSLVSARTGDSGDLWLAGAWVGLASVVSEDSGDIDLDWVEVESLALATEDSGDLRVAGGAASWSTVSVADSGDVEAPGLVVAVATIDAAGSGDVSLEVTDTAYVTITDSGDVVLTGSPAVILVDSGSGQLVTP